MKECYRCRESKALDQFNRRKRSRDGRDGICSECERSRLRASRAEKGEQVRERERAYRAARSDEYAQRHREWREQNPEYGKEYREKNPEQAWLDLYRRRCRGYGLTPAIEPFTKQDVIDWWGNGWRCIYCDRPATGVDHLTPVGLGGMHGTSNVAPCCRDCNLVTAASVAAARAAA